MTAPKVGSPEWLLSRRRALGMTQVEFAKRLGVSQASVSYWEWNERTITPRTIKQVQALKPRRNP